MEVYIASPMEEDRDTARCRLPAKQMRLLGKDFGTPIIIVSKVEAYLCSLYPHPDRFATMTTMDTLVECTNLISSSVNDTIISAGEPTLANHIEVIITMKPGMTNPMDPMTSQSQVSSLLCNKYVTPGCIITPGLASFSAIGSLQVVKCRGDKSPIRDKTTGLEIWKVGVSTYVRIIDDPSTKLSDSTSIMPGSDIPSVGGLGVAKQALIEVIGYPLQYKSMFTSLGLEPPKGVLLYGLPGVGKTLLVSSVARQCGAHVIVVNGPSIYGAYLGESEQNLQRIFREATASAKEKPTVLFIDEIDALCPSRDESGSAESRVVATLLTLMDGIEGRGDLVVIGATNRPNAIDQALRRPGRFDREIHIDVPGEDERRAILEVHSRALPLVDVDLEYLSKVTKGYVGADLAALCREAATSALKRYKYDQPDRPTVTGSDFDHALAVVCPSTQRGSLVDFEKKSWDEIGGMENVKQMLKEAIEWPIKYRESFERLGLGIPKGVLLYGPPGCSKTTLVKAVASTANCTFLAVSGAQVYSPYVGEAEKTIRELFRKARQGAPSVVFLDEVEAMVGKRGAGLTSAGVSERILSTLLNEMDGVVDAGHVVCVAATNRPDMLDEALLRPGRFDKIVYVPPPDHAARLAIFKVHTKKTPLASDIDLCLLADQTELYSGADIENVCREAAIHALRRDLLNTPVVGREDFKAAMDSCRPSLTAAQLLKYQSLSKMMSA